LPGPPPKRHDGPPKGTPSYRPKATLPEGRAERHRFYDSKLWKQCRAVKLLDDPLCERCLAAGRVEAGRHVDHLIPLADGGEPLDVKNLQSLCHSCHSWKSGMEKKERKRDGR
jgi:5-methylcytosine-specific restriction endonuclease McrA